MHSVHPSPKIYKSCILYLLMPMMNLCPFPQRVTPDSGNSGRLLKSCGTGGGRTFLQRATMTRQPPVRRGDTWQKIDVTG